MSSLPHVGQTGSLTQSSPNVSLATIGFGFMVLLFLFSFLPYLPLVGLSDAVAPKRKKPL